MDSHSFQDLDKEFQRVITVKRQEQEHELEKLLMNRRFNPGTTKQEMDNARQVDRDNFWKSKQVELDQHREQAEQTIFQDWGGSREAAEQQMVQQRQLEQTEQQRQQEQRKHRVQEQMRQSWQRQQQQGQDHQAQVLNLMDEKKKKEQQAREDQEQKLQQQRNLEDEKQKRMDYMRNQFNARQRANGRDM